MNEGGVTSSFNVTSSLSMRGITRCKWIKVAGEEAGCEVQETGAAPTPVDNAVKLELVGAGLTFDAAE